MGRPRACGAPRAHPVAAMRRYVDHFMYKGHLCIITEFCEAGDLYG